MDVTMTQQSLIWSNSINKSSLWGYKQEVVELSSFPKYIRICTMTMLNNNIMNFKLLSIIWSDLKFGKMLLGQLPLPAYEYQIFLILAEYHIDKILRSYLYIYIYYDMWCPCERTVRFMQMQRDVCQLPVEFHDIWSTCFRSSSARKWSVASRTFLQSRISWPPV